MERDQIRRRSIPQAPGPGTHSVSNVRNARYCECCGNQLSSTAAFCSKCGTQAARESGVVVTPLGVSPAPSTVPIAEKRMVEQYRMNIKRIEDMLRYRNDMDRAYGPDGRNSIERAFNIIRSHMDGLIQNRIVSPTEEEVRIVNRSVDALIKQVMYGPISKIVRDISVELGVLVFNWSRQTIHNTELEMKTQVVDRILKGEKTMEDTILVLRSLLDRARDAMRYTPASFELSRHYLRSLEEEE